MNAYRRLLADLAVPRLSGSPANARVRAMLTRELEQRGFVVLEHQFPVRPPGRLAGPFLAGGMLAGATAAAAILAMLHSPSTALIAAFGAALVIWLGILLASLRRAPVVGINLIAVRPRTRVRVWLAAHYDSKGQPISMFTRIAAAVLAFVGAGALILLGATRLDGTVWSPPFAALVALPGIAGGLLLLGNRVTNGSPGALDNATALVTVLSIIDQLPPDAAVGILLPDAEEFGLLGARALARERSNLLENTAVLNFDGIDDRGATVCLVHRGGETVDAVTRRLGARRRRLLPVVVDGWELARVAGECMTVMRGDWRTTLIVHTPADTADRLTLDGSAVVAAHVAAALRERMSR